jgi:hypothetical protein
MNFYDSLYQGLEPEETFIVWATLSGHTIHDVRNSEKYRKMDIDFGIERGETKLAIDVKKGIANYVAIEESSNHPALDGWFYKSKADAICFIDVANETLTFLVLSKEMKAHYETIKGRYELKLNEPSTANGRIWQSAFRVIPMVELKQFIVVKSLNR